MNATHGQEVDLKSASELDLIEWRMKTESDIRNLQNQLNVLTGEMALRVQARRAAKAEETKTDLKGD